MHRFWYLKCYPDISLCLGKKITVVRRIELKIPKENQKIFKKKTLKMNFEHMFSQDPTKPLNLRFSQVLTRKFYFRTL